MQGVPESGVLTRRPLLARDVQAYYLCEDLTEIVICFMVVFSPWAFGTTEPWSIWTMNTCGYALGMLLVIKLTIRSVKGYRPGRWGDDLGKAVKRESAAETETRLVATHYGPRASRLASRIACTPDVLTRVLAVLAFAVLGYCLIAAVNARAAFSPASQTFIYHDHIRWLPHSFDSQCTWGAFWMFLALACSFWAIRDWLSGKSTVEERADLREATSENGKVSAALFPVRLSRLLWVLAISGGLLGLEGIVQRLLSSPKLLFLVKPEIHQSAETQFASYAYRANGGQYFNLLWPVCLGFWWVLRHSRGVQPIAKRLLLVCTAIMAACPLISSARGAALVAVGLLSSAALVLLRFICCVNAQRGGRRGAPSAALMLVFLASALALGLGFGWKHLRPRMAEFKDGLEDREQIYERARPIARDYPVFGTGPGTFEPVFQLYRVSAEAYWPAQLHNDWLEMRITFGWAGCSLIAGCMLTVLLRWFAPGGIHAGRRFVSLTWLALAGCLVQARWDFPLQVYSIQFLFLVWCAMLFTLSRKS